MNEKGINMTHKMERGQERYQKRKKLMNSRKETRIFRILLHVEVLVILIVLSFFLGREIGRDSLKEQLAEVILRLDKLEQVQNNIHNEMWQQDVSGSNQIYGSEQTGNSVGYVEEPLTDKITYQEFLENLYEDAPQLILVNKDYKLSDDYEIELKRLYDGTNNASVIAYDALNKMLKAGRKQGLNFEICSSYRSVQRQQELLDEDIDALMDQGYTYKKAYEEVTRETMPPGYSEHATGLAFDIVSLSYQMLDAYQERTAEVKWLHENCAEYGFILRYPKDKEDITGISYESWHFRYVGEEAAGYIMENDITLEEYLEELYNKKEK